MDILCGKARVRERGVVVEVRIEVDVGEVAPRVNVVEEHLVTAGEVLIDARDSLIHGQFADRHAGVVHGAGRIRERRIGINQVDGNRIETVRRNDITWKRLVVVQRIANYGAGAGKVALALGRRKDNGGSGAFPGCTSSFIIQHEKGLVAPDRSAHYSAELVASQHVFG